MLWKMIQHTFSGGRLDKEIMGRQDLASYFKGCSELRNFMVTRQGNLSKRRGTNLACTLAGIGLTSMTHKARIIPLVYDRDNGYYLLFAKSKIFLVSRDGILNTSGSFVSAAGSDSFYINSPVTDSMLDEFDYVQSGDTIFLVHGDFAPRKIVFTHANLGQAQATYPALEISVINFQRSTAGKPATPTATKEGFDSESGADRTVKYKVSAITADGDETVCSDKCDVTYKLPWNEEALVSLSISSPASVTAKPQSYYVYKDQGSGYGLIGVVTSDDIGAASPFTATFQDDYITPDMTQTPPVVESHFNSVNNYPMTVGIYQQRLVFCGTYSQPFTFWMSTTGSLYDFDVHESIREDDAIEATLSATEMPEINHAIVSKDLMLFTNSGEWQVAPVSGNSLSYKTVSANMQSAIGCVKCTKPVIIGDEIVFVDSTGTKLLATRYNFASDGYESQDLTVMSQWIFKNNDIKRIAYKRSPDSVIECVLSDGSIASLVYMKEHEVCAWSRQVFGNDYHAKDVACSKASRNGTTDTMFLVNKGTAWELWNVRDDVPVRTSSATEDFVCMDRVYEATAGEVVAADMVAVDPATGTKVSAGGTATAGMLIGYPFLSKVTSIYPEPNGSDTIQMEIKNATEAEVRVIDSSPFYVRANGVSEGYAKLVDIPVSVSSGTVSLGDKDARVVLGGANSRDGRVNIMHQDIYPLNILSLAVTYQIEAANQNGSGVNG